ncbi:hypothetical protein H5P36_03910 [Bacillus sp. APMAM]|nr:hypothetical protein [Bacillus sp. APMAM]RTZ56129.1 hypothetical protein EKO25_08910 [Bacillus sp. SAJ1]
MKNLLLFTMSTLLIVINLIGCEHPSKRNDPRKPINISKRKFIILDSVNAPLPPEIKAIKSMPSTLEPQQIPNANWKDPIVITKMPLKNRK